MTHPGLYKEKNVGLYMYFYWFFDTFTTVHVFFLHLLATWFTYIVISVVCYAMFHQTSEEQGLCHEIKSEEEVVCKRPGDEK
jgi:ABC-type Co2+ transport system permease subunit